MMTLLRWTALMCLIQAVTGAEPAAANAALAKYGTRVEVTCTHVKPINATWAKPEDLLRAEKPAGPIINDLATARITLNFPVRLGINKVGFALMGKKDAWPRASRIDVLAGGAVVASLNLDIEETKLQVFDIPTTRTDTLVFAVTALQPATATVPYGGFSQVAAFAEDDLAALFAAPVSVERPARIMGTANVGARPRVPVIGSPRKTSGFPRTIWDAADIAELKRHIASEPAAKEAYARCLAYCNQAVAQPVQVPAEADMDTDPTVAAGHTRAVDAISNLGIGYALSGDERYATEVRRLLLRYAELYEGWPVHASPNFRHDKSKWSWQRLNEAIWLIPAVWGFDLVYSSPSLSDADRAQIRDHFIMPCVRQILSSPAIIAAPTNWSVIACAAVMMGARVSGDDAIYAQAINGLPKKKASAKQPAGAATDPADAPSGNNGGIYYHLDVGIDDDGLWGEGAMGYQFMAMRGLVVMAEVLWHDGIDVWGYRNSRLKLVFDSPIWYCYPGGRDSPAIHDSGSASLFSRDAHIYQYALRRYGDRTYNAILSRITHSLACVYNQFLPSFDFSAAEVTGLPATPSILFPGVGFAITRAGEGTDARYLLMDYGPNRSHGHPDKLNHCLFALGQELYADAGTAWYATDAYKRYYSTTLAHNTVSANGQNQIMAGGRLEAYCQAGDAALIRASCDSAIPATGLDRTLVMLGNRLYDLYRVRGANAAVLDLPFHSYGTVTPDAGLAAALKPWTGAEKSAPGYAYFSDPRIAACDTDWSCTWKLDRGTMRMHALAEPGTEVLFATTPKGGAKLGTVMLRRRTADTVFASVSDIIPAGAAASVTSIHQLRGEGGMGLVAELADGAGEVVLSSTGGAAFTLGGWQTDAGVAAVRWRGAQIENLILSGGTTFSGSGLSLRLSEPGLISAYAVKPGLIRCTNHGTQPVEVTWGGLTVTQVAQLDAAGAWTSCAPVTGGRFTVPASAGVDLSMGGEETVARWESDTRRAKQEQAWQAEQQRKAAQAADAAGRLAQARKEPIPADYRLLIEAENLSAQSGGEIVVTDKKTAAHGTSISRWDASDHALEYTCEVAHTGWYQIGIKYCLEGGDPATRVVRVDGELPHPSLALVSLPGTGGWSNGADNWSLIPICLPDSTMPAIIRLEKGRHVVRLESPAGGGLNLDYLVLVPAEADLRRDRIEK